MKQILPKHWTLGAAIVVGSLGTGCPQDDLVEMTPRIRVDACRTDGVADCVLDAGRVPLGSEQLLAVAITNTGEADLHLQQVVLADGSEASFSIPDDIPTVVLPGSQHAVKVVLRYAPTDSLSATGLLRIVSDGDNVPAATRAVEVHLQGTAWDARAPRFNLAPAQCDFGEVELPGIAACALTIGNQGTAALRVEELAIPASAPEFQWTAESQPPLELAPGATTTVQVRFRPTAAREYATWLTVRTSDSPREHVQVALTGRGGMDPVAAARVESVNGVPGVPAVMRPLDDVVLTAADSAVATPGRTLTAYQWRLTAVPEGSTVTLTHPEGVRTGFQFNSSGINRHGLDVVGSYTVTLLVTDSAGHPSANTAQLTLDAIPTEDLHVQLTWDDAASDVDLHLVRGAADAFGEEDCYYATCKAVNGLNWGGGARNPHLDVDDTSGFGPENINVVGPADGTYAVGVHFYAGHGTEQTAATVKVFVQGHLQGEFRRQLRCAAPAYWQVARVTWGAAPAVDAVDQLVSSGHGECEP